MTAPSPEARTYTVEEAAAVLGIGRTLARRLTREGNMPGAFRLGNRWLVSRGVIDQLAATGEVPYAEAEQ